MPPKKRKEVPRLKGINSVDMAAYQKNLDSFCGKYNIEPWKITSGKGRWRELVLSLCGVPEGPKAQKNQKGRPARPEEEVLRIGLDVERRIVHEGFEDLTQKKYLRAPRVPNKQIYAEVAKEIEISSGGKISISVGAVRSICDRYKELYKEAREKEDWSEDPGSDDLWRDEKGRPHRKVTKPRK